MRMLRAASLLLALSVPLCVVQAADFVNLDWGDFKLSYESSTKPKSVVVDSKAGELGLSITLDNFTASADGAKREGSASVEGEFVVQQPASVKLPAMSIELRGTLVKTPGTSAEMIVEIGSAQQKISWPQEESVAGAYSKVLTVANPNGELPTPFPVKVQAFVGRTNGSGGVMLTLDSIDVRVGQPQVSYYFDAEPQFTARTLAATEALKPVIASK